MKKSFSIIFTSIIFTSIVFQFIGIQTWAQTQESFLTSSCLNPPPQSCAFYTSCLEVVVPCGDSGYAKAYGDRYCHRFLSIEDQLSPSGKLFNESTRNCLQKALVPILIPALRQQELKSTNTCQAITDFAFDSHPDCYTNHENSICFLNPLTDLPLIFEQYDAEDLLTKKSFEQMTSVIEICMAQVTDRLVGVFPISDLDLDTRKDHKQHFQALSDQLNFWVAKKNQYSSKKLQLKEH